MSQASSQFETETRVDVRSLPGYRWDESGQSVLSGALLDLYRRIDNMFLRWAGDCQAPEFFFPTFISAHELGKLDYFRSFPQLVTFPAVLDASETNLKSFAEGEPLDSQGCVHLTALDSVRNVLTPAACYHFYVLFQGQTLEEPRYVTTRATCFRRENHYLPLERQWNFSMREIVCIGSSDEVKSFLARYREKVDAFFRSVNLPIQWDAATDPFFKREWKVLRWALRNAFTLTIFGYRAPDTDRKAIEVMKRAWKGKGVRQFEQTEIIERMTEGEATERWRPFIFSGHWDYRRTFYESSMALHPRRSCEALYERTVMARWDDPHPLPQEQKELEPRPEADNLVGIYAALADTGKADVLKQFGGAQFSTFKNALVELLVAKLAPINAEMRRLADNPAYIDSVLADGAARAQRIASETMKAVKDIVGFVHR